MSFVGTPTRRPGPPLWLALVLLISGVVVAFATAAVFASKAIGTDRSAPTFSTPGSEHVYLRAGAYDLFTNASASDLDADNVTVTNASGSPMALSQVSDGQSFAEGNTTYHAALMFQATEPGSYSIVVKTDADYFAVAPDLQSIITWNSGWLAGLLVSLIVGLIGLVLLVVGLMRRSQGKRRMALGTGPGGYGAGPPWAAGPSWGGQGWPPPGMPPPGTQHPGMPPPGASPGAPPGMSPGGANQPWQPPQWQAPGGWTPGASPAGSPAAMPPAAPRQAPPAGTPPHPGDWSPHPTPRPPEPAVEPPAGGDQPEGAPVDNPTSWPDVSDQAAPPSGGLGP
jgi:hypothetical protein